MSDYTITWTKTWDDPLCQPGECRHAGSAALSINQRLVPKGRSGQRQIAMDGSICMNCGADVTGNLSMRDGLALCMKEHGWHRSTALRLYDIVNFHAVELYNQNDRLPLWFAYAWDWPWEKIKAEVEACAALDEAAE